MASGRTDDTAWAEAEAVLAVAMRVEGYDFFDDLEGSHGSADLATTYSPAS